ncbi:MAG TPA: hypothetical protein VFV72_15295 [Candidatus Limnocylindrales bacterium]|nr:hypothetical protein [Candidatus Limnocylindrales bacterium]
MALWRCPHCGTPQPVAARCWVCRRSSTSCGTCRHFRASVAANLGYCGLDRDRLPLAGSEIRGCWDGIPIDEDADARPPAVDAPALARSPYMRGFVPVDELLVEAVLVPAAEPVPDPAPAPPPSPPPDGMLWADLEG